MLVAGAGGLGSHVLQSIARLGPLRLEVWDPGVLDEPDLNRQILYEESDLGRRKADVAAERLRAINTDLDVTVVLDTLNYQTFRDYSSLRDRAPSDATSSPDARASMVIFDCLDSFVARAGIAPIADALSAPIFHGGVEGWCGQATTILPGTGGYAGRFGPEFASIPPAMKLILTQTVSTIAALQVAEYLHWCDDPGETPLSRRLMLYDGKSLRFDSIEISIPTSAGHSGPEELPRQVVLNNLTRNEAGRRVSE